MNASTSPLPSSSNNSPTSVGADGVRRRRKREAIELPSDLALADMDPKEVKKIKNRIAAARLRERSHRQIRELEEQVARLRARNELLETTVAQCPHCSVLVGHLDSAVKVEPTADAAMDVKEEENQLPLRVDALDLTDADCAALQDLLDVW